MSKIQHLMTDRQLGEYYYGYNLKLADELAEFDDYIGQPVNLEDKVELCNKLKKRLYDECLQDTPLGKGQRMKHLVLEVFNDPIHKLEEDYYVE